MRSRIAMAAQAERANILEIALASAFNDRNDVIGIPEALARPATQAPVRKQRRAICAARIAESACFGNRVYCAGGTNTAIAMKHLLSKICGLSAQFPLVHTELRAEGVPSARNLKRAPATQAAAVGATWNCLAINPAAAHGA